SSNSPDVPSACLRPADERTEPDGAYCESRQYRRTRCLRFRSSRRTCSSRTASVPDAPRAREASRESKRCRSSFEVSPKSSEVEPEVQGVRQPRGLDGLRGLQEDADVPQILADRRDRVTRAQRELVLVELARDVHEGHLVAT